MNKIRSPKIFLLIISLALLITNGCVELPKDRPSTSLKNPVAHCKEKPKVQLTTHFDYLDNSGLKYNYRHENDTLRKIVEKVIKKNELFDSQSAEPICFGYEIVFYLAKTPKRNLGKQTVKDELWGSFNASAYLGSLTILPFAEPMIYDLKVTVIRSGKDLYVYSCTNESTDVHGPLFTGPNNPPLKMIEKMVKEALFNVIDNSGIRESYKLEP